MRVRRIEVKGLFGVFHHVIPLRMDERVTIIHGPNGFGKTILLEMIDGLLRGDYAPFRRVPFKEFVIEFENQSVCRVLRSEADASLNSSLIYPDGREENLPTSIGKNILTTLTNQELTLRPSKSPLRPSKSNLRAPPKISDLLDESDFRRAIHVRLIQTRRLDAIDYSRRVTVATVQRYSDELAREMNATLNVYAKCARELERSFPSRLLGNTPIKRLTQEELEHALTRQDQTLTNLVSLGFLDSEERLRVPPIEDKTKLDVMSIYVQDIDEKFAVFDELATKLRLFVDIIRNRFQYKTMTTHRERGIILTAPNGAELPITALSSGEQHIIVLLCELLFKSQKDALFLLDEPELSLHLLWQQPFLDDLLKIVKLSNVDVMLATHSPDIIDRHWNLTEALKGPQP